MYTFEKMVSRHMQHDPATRGKFFFALHFFWPDWPPNVNFANTRNESDESECVNIRMALKQVLQKRSKYLAI